MTTDEMRHARHAPPESGTVAAPRGVVIPSYERSATTIMGLPARLDLAVPRDVIGLEYNGVIVGVLLQRAGTVQPEHGPVAPSASAAL